MKMQIMHKEKGISNPIPISTFSLLFKNSFCCKLYNHCLPQGGSIAYFSTISPKAGQFPDCPGWAIRLKSSRRQKQSLVRKCLVKARIPIHEGNQKWAKSCTRQSCNCVEEQYKEIRVWDIQWKRRARCCSYPLPVSAEVLEGLRSNSVQMYIPHCHAQKFSFTTNWTEVI